MTIAGLFLLAWGLAAFYKKEILRELTTTLERSINGRLHIEDADLAFFATFPDLSLRLEEISLKETDTSPQEILKAERIYLTVKFFPLLNSEVHFKSLRVDNASVFVYRSKAGELNLDRLKKSGAADSSGVSAVLNLSAGEVRCKNMQLTYHDSLRRKFFGLRLVDVTSEISLSDSGYRQHSNGQVFFDQLVFNAKRGAFLKEKLANIDLRLRRVGRSHVFEIDSSTVELAKSRLQLRATVNAPDSGKVFLHIESPALHYQEALGVLPPSIAAKLKVIDIAKPFAYAIDIVAPLGVATDPMLDMNFSFSDNRLESPSKKITLEHVTLTGTFTNHIDDALPVGDQNTEIQLKKVQGTLEKLPFTAEAWLTDLSELKLRLHSEHRFDAKLLRTLVDSTRVRIEHGTVYSAFDYEGKLSDYLNDSATTFHGKIDGHSEWKDVALTWVPRKLRFEKINSRINFNEDTVWLKNLSVVSGRNELKAKGIMCNYVPFFTQPTKKGFVKLDLQSSFIDLSTLLTKRVRKKGTARQRREARARLSNVVDGIFSTLEFQVSLNVEKVKRQSFMATNLTGTLQLGKNQLQADKMKMNFGGGQLDASFLMKNLDKDINPIYLTAYTSNVNISELFRAFDNFHQTAITSKHLEGTISTSAKLSGKINDAFEFQRASLWGPVKVTVKKGKINNLPAFDKLSNFLLKRRDFDHVQFAQIDGRMFVKGREMEIERMEIQSNVLGLFLEGIYSMRNKTDLTIQVPLSNLKKRDKSFSPKRVGTDAKVGPSVFLKAVSNDKGETEISYDLFHKFRKKK